MTEKNTLINENLPPSFVQLDDISIKAGEKSTIQLKVDDNEGDRHSYLLIDGPSGMTISENTGLISWVPENRDAGSNVVSVHVLDQDGMKDDASFTIKVYKNCTKPQITKIEDMVISSGDERKVALYFSDHDENDSHRISVQSDDINVSVSQVNHFRSGAEFSIRPSNGYTGKANITVTVEDDCDQLSDQVSFGVTTVQTNIAPVISQITRQYIQVGERLELDVEAYDQNNSDILAYKIVSGPGEMTIDSKGIIQWTPRVGDVGTHQVSLAVNDNGSNPGPLESTAQFSIIVNPDCHPPEIQPIADLTIFSGDTIIKSVRFADPDANDKHIIEVSADKSGIILREQPTFPSGAEYSITAKSSFTGQAIITVKVTDHCADLSDETTFKIDVEAKPVDNTAEPEPEQETKTVPPQVQSLVIEKQINVTLKDDQGYPIPNAKVFVDGNQIGKTNELGLLSAPVRYEEDSGTKNLSYEVDGFTHEAETIDLSGDSVSYNSSAVRLRHGIKAGDGSQSISGLDIKASGPGTLLDVEYEFGIYWLTFSEIGNYQVTLEDRNDAYDDGSLTINLDKRNVGSSSTIELKPTVFLDAIVVDSTSQPVKDATIYLEGIVAGSTDQFGKLRVKTSLNDSPTQLKVEKDGFLINSSEIKLSPGINIKNISMEDLPAFTIKLINNETSEAIPGQTLQVNGSQMTTDSDGQIIILPGRYDERYNIEYSSDESQFFNLKKTIPYNSEGMPVTIELTPVSYLNFTVTYVDGKTAITGIQILVDGHSPGVTDINGKLTHRIPDIRKSYEILIQKTQFVDYHEILQPSSSITDIPVLLERCQQSIVVKNMFGQSTKDVELSFGDYTNTVNEFGVADIYCDQLDAPMTIGFHSITGVYTDTVMTFVFPENNTTTDVTLTNKPITLQIHVQDNLGIPSNGEVTINPPPANLSKFNLNGGIASIKVWQSGKYTVCFNAKAGNAAVRDCESVNIDIAKGDRNEIFIISNARIKAHTNESVPLKVVYKGPGTKTYDLIGDGLDEITVDDYGDYEFIFLPPGFVSEVHEIRTIDNRENILYFKYGQDYLAGIKALNEGNVGDAIQAFERVKEQDPNHCSALERLYEIYVNNYSDFQNGEAILSKYVEKMSDATCELNFSMYSIYVDIAAHLEFVDYSNANRIWGPEGSIDNAFSESILYCPVQSNNCAEKEESLRVLIIRGAAEIMRALKQEYEITLNPTKVEQIRELNNYLYEKITIYADGVPSTKSASVLNSRDQYFIQ